LSGNIFLPEATVVSSSGDFYVSSGNGSILKIDNSKKEYHHMVHTGGRPLGLAFAKDGRLLVADALIGLLAVDLNSRSIEIVCNFAGGKPVRFANAVTVAQDGTIFFSDSGEIAPVQQLDGLYGTHHSAVVQIMVAEPTGRVIKVDMETRKAEVILDALSFANGVALSPDDSFLLVSDLGRNSIRRLWLSGEKRGRDETVLDELPGFPDNIQRSSDGGFWVALASPRSNIIDAAHPYPWIKSLILKIPMSVIPKPPPRAQVLKLSKDLKIEYKLFDETGHIPVVTDAMEYQGKLYLAAVNAYYWGFIDLSHLK
jgi:sugar lactone lactonase YvrE